MVLSTSCSHQRYRVGWGDQVLPSGVHNREWDFFFRDGTSPLL